MPAISRPIVICAVFMLTACASQPEIFPGMVNPVYTALVIRTEPVACGAQLGLSSRSQRSELDSSDIRMVNWNIQKGGNPDWAADLNSFTGEPDLMIFQEAALNTAAWSIVGTDQYRSFAPGSRTRQSLTGVMTISSAEPLTQCNLSSVEPWLRSPKATIITEYGLTGTDESLLVVNIHAVNFTIGASDFREQIQKMESVVAIHQGPILLSGDFNTWGWRRGRILDEMTDSLGLSLLDYEVDHRKRIFGKVLDRIYVRGLKVLESTTQRVNSSDHNPMSVRMRL